MIKLDQSHREAIKIIAMLRKCLRSRLLELLGTRAYPLASPKGWLGTGLLCIKSSQRGPRCEECGRPIRAKVEILLEKGFLRPGWMM